MQHTQYESDPIFKSHMGHADLFCLAYCHDLVITGEQGSGYLYNPRTALWEPCNKSQIIRMIPPFLDQEVQQRRATYLQSTTVLQELDRLSKKVVTATHAKDVFMLCKAHPMIFNPAFVSKLNKAKNLFPCQGRKVVMLDQNKCRERGRADFFTFECPVALITSDFQNATKFFMEVCNCNHEVFTHLLKTLGCALTGESSRSFSIFWGEGSNGKSVVTSLMKKIMGPFFGAIDKSLVIKSKRDAGAGAGSGCTSQLLPLKNCRLCVCSETEMDDKLDSEGVKRITGGDAMYARWLYQDPTEFVSAAKIWALTNHAIQINTKDQAVIDRLMYIPFVSRFTQNPKDGERKRNDYFVQQLENEYLNEVFSLICSYACEWYKTRDVDLILPDILKCAKNSYVSEQDSVLCFLETACVTGKKFGFQKTECFEAYKVFCSEQGFSYEKPSAFAKIMMKKFGEGNLRKFGGRYYKGVMSKRLNYDDADVGSEGREVDWCDDGEQKENCDAILHI